MQHHRRPCPHKFTVGPCVRGEEVGVGGSEVAGSRSVSVQVISEVGGGWVVEVNVGEEENFCWIIVGKPVEV